MQPWGNGACARPVLPALRREAAVLAGTHAWRYVHRSLVGAPSSPFG